jgi:hypothetical protein
MARNKAKDAAAMPSRTAVSTAESPIADYSDQQVAARAYEKWLARGCPIGDDLRDWFEAEQELRGAQSRPS